MNAEDATGGMNGRPFDALRAGANEDAWLAEALEVVADVLRAALSSGPRSAERQRLCKQLAKVVDDAAEAAEEAEREDVWLELLNLAATRLRDHPPGPEHWREMAERIRRTEATAYHDGHDVYPPRREQEEGQELQPQDGGM